MAFGQAEVSAVYKAMISHAQQTGLFPGGVESHEPVSEPGAGLTLALVEGPIVPAPSGLAATSVGWQWMLRLYSPWRPETAATIDPASGVDAPLTAAAMTLLASYASDLDLTEFGAPAGLVRQVDVLGARTDPKWIDQAGSVYRLREITVQITINDAYSQVV